MYDELEDNEYYSQPDKNWKPGHVYVVDYGDGVTFKIGHTTVSPEARLKQIAKGSVIMPMQLVMSVDTTNNAHFLENVIHMALDSDHVRGEWFKLDFVKLVELYQLLNYFGHVELYDRWYEVVPKDYQHYIDHGALTPNYPYFTKAEKKRVWDSFMSTDWDKLRTQLHNERMSEHGAE